jgi:hypothetical protein
MRHRANDHVPTRLFRVELDTRRNPQCRPAVESLTARSGRARQRAVLRACSVISAFGMWYTPRGTSIRAPDRRSVSMLDFVPPPSSSWRRVAMPCWRRSKVMVDPGIADIFAPRQSGRRRESVNHDVSDLCSSLAVGGRLWAPSRIRCRRVDRAGRFRIDRRGPRRSEFVLRRGGRTRLQACGRTSGAGRHAR